MHYLRKLERERRGDLPSDDGDRSVDATCPGSPLKVKNPTGVFLDHVAGRFAVTLKSGKRGVQASNFMDRLLTASPVVEPAPSREDRRSRSKLSSTPAGVSQHVASVVGVPALRQHHQVPRLVDNDDGDRMMSARSGASSSAASAAPQRQQQQQQPQRSPSDDLIDDADDGFERIDKFFLRMRQDLREMRRLNVADLVQGTPRNALRRLTSGLSASSPASSSSAASLHPLIRVDAKKREATNQLFGALQQPAIRDTVRADVTKHLEYRDKKYHQSVHLIVDPARALLEAVWEQHRVPQAERSAFGAMYFNNGDIASFNAISRELQRYHCVSDIDVELTRSVQFRESLVGQLKDLLSNPVTPLDKLDGGGGDHGRGNDATVVTKAEGFVMTILNSLLLLRHVTCAIVEMVFAKRTGASIDAPPALSSGSNNNTNRGGGSAHQTHASQHGHQQTSGMTLPPGTASSSAEAAETVVEDFVLLWRDNNYLHTMQTDLDFLQGTVVAELLGREYLLQGNPLTLPTEVHTTCERRVDAIHNHSATVHDVLQARAGRSLTTTPTESNHGVSERPMSVLATSSTTIISPTSVAHGVRPASRSFLSTPTSKRTASPQPSRVVCLREGEEVVVGRPSLEEEAAASTASRAGAKSRSTPRASGHLTGTSPIGTPPTPSASLARDQYFAKLRKEELMRTRRIDMDRSNVYVYPASVYKVKPVPIRTTLSDLLRRSLDPRIPAKSYDDVTEYEQLQFGRLAVPPSVCSPWVNSMVDAEHHCFRTVRGEIPIVPYDALVKRDILLFAERTVLLRASAHRKLRRGLERFKMAYRGFVCTMRRRRLPPTTSEECVREFLAWVSVHAPSWASDARAAIGSGGGDDDLQLMGMLTSGD